MDRKIKLIWDFRGRDTKKTAQHHCIHLEEYASIEKIKFYNINHLELTKMHCIAFMIVNEVAVAFLRKTLKPHRGQLAD